MNESASRLSEILNNISENSQIIKQKLKLEQDDIAELQSIIEHDLDNLQQLSAERPALIIIYSGQYEQELRLLAENVLDRRIGKNLQKLIGHVQKFREEFASKLKSGWYINDEEERTAIIKFVEEGKRFLNDFTQAQEDVKESEDKFSRADV